MPTAFEMIVSSGTMNTPASTRGTASLRTGSVPSARSALICSVTIIDPSSAAMPDPTRPVTISAVSTGPELLDHRGADQPPDGGRARRTDRG